MRDLTEPEVEDLTAFLRTLTDYCVADTVCVTQWVPSGSEDPDGNLLRMGSPSPVDYELAGPPAEDEPAPGSVGLIYRDPAPLPAFPELGSCGESPAINMGVTLFVPRAEHLLLGEESGPLALPLSPGAVFEHGFSRETWFVDNKHGTVMMVGGLAATYLNGDYRRELFLGNLYASEEWVAARGGQDVLSRKHVTVLSTGGDGTVYPAGRIPVSRNTFGISFGDVDGDADPDLYLGHWGPGTSTGGEAFWENRPENATLVPAGEAFGLGPASGIETRFNFAPVFWDLDGDGAIAAGETQLRVAQANTNFLSQNLPNLHFGLRDAESVGVVRVQWPGDAGVLECTGVAVNQFLVFDQRNKQCP